MERERGVILEEINMYEDNPRADISEIYEGLVYKGHPLARKIIGPKSVISKITKKELLEYRNSFYYGANSVVAVAGKVSPNELMPNFSHVRCLLRTYVAEAGSSPTRTVAKPGT